MQFPIAFFTIRHKILDLNRLRRGIVLDMKFFGMWVVFCASLFGAEERAVLAGGCFWCLQADLDALEGVVATAVGYEGGDAPNPTYELVSTGLSGYVEAVEVLFDSEKLSYEDLLGAYWRMIDPTRADGQFCDTGSQYRPAIFYFSEEQRAAAEASRCNLAREVSPIQVAILPGNTFYRAEEFHQKYYLKNPLRYKFYRRNCGRDRRLFEIWKSN